MSAKAHTFNSFGSFLLQLSTPSSVGPDEVFIVFALTASEPHGPLLVWSIRALEPMGRLIRSIVPTQLVERKKKVEAEIDVVMVDKP